VILGALVVGLGLDGESPCVDGVLGLSVSGVVSAVFTVRVSIAVFSTTYFLMTARVTVASSSSLLGTRVSVVTSSLPLVLRVLATTISS
jgi:hypothetical protein